MLKMKNGATLVLACSAMVLMPGLAAADTFKGTIVGHTCAHQGKSCPVDRLDPHIALEPDFVLQRGTDDYLFMPNLPRDVKVRYVLQTVSVKGALNTRYNTVVVDEVHVDGKMVWSQKIQQEQIDCIYDETCQFAY